MKKRFLSLLLVAATLMGLLAVPASAAASVTEALGEIDIYNGGYPMSYLSINGRNRELIYTYYNYVDSDGKEKEIPAYCVNPNTKGVPQSVAASESIRYKAEEIGTDPKAVGIVANGYSTRGLGELKLENKEQAYYATKMALWCYILPHWDINDLKVNPSLSGVELTRAQNILRAAKDITALTTTGTGDGYAVFYATCAETDKYGNLQNYLVDTDPTAEMRLSAYSNYTSADEPAEDETALRIIKLESGTETPLSGALFEVIDPKGTTVACSPATAAARSTSL